jgi:hypothetical protein
MFLVRVSKKTRELDASAQDEVSRPARRGARLKDSLGLRFALTQSSDARNAFASARAY